MKKTIIYTTIMYFLFLTIIMCSCNKSEINIEDSILWENSTPDTVNISIIGTKFILGLMPKQNRMFGNKSIIGKKYIIMETSEQFIITERNTIYK